MKGKQHHGPCPSCPSSDGYTIDPKTGWGHCFVCSLNVPPGKVKDKLEAKRGKNKNDGPITPIPDAGWGTPAERGISRATAEKYKIWTAADGSSYFPAYSDGQHVGTKKRFGEKEFKWEGKSDGELFGSWLFPRGSAKAITLTEGEYDAAAGYELLGSKFPVVSVLNGTGTAERDVRNNFEYLDSFDKIVVCFDADDAGRKAAKQVAGLFAPGKVYICDLREGNDPNEYLIARNHGRFTKEWWQAVPYMPDGLKIGTNMWDEIINRPKHFTVDYPFAGLNKLLYGLRLSEMLTVTADPKVGKTTFLKELEYSLLMNPELIEKGYGVGFIHLEEPNYDTALGLMSIHASKPYHLPDTERTPDDLRSAYDAVINSSRVVIWDHFGSNSVNAVVDKVRHMAALGCKYIVLDHVSIVVSDQSGDERKQLDEIATKLKTLCMNLNIALICVIHQNRQGQIRGTMGFEQLSNIVIKLERDKLDADEWRRNVTKIIVTENRFCGKTGPASYLWYNGMTGRMMELDEEEVKKFETGEGMRDDRVPF